MHFAANAAEILIVPAAFAGVAAISRAASLTGASLGFALAVVLYSGAGRGGFAALATFVVLGSAATRLGARRKQRLGIAQADGGRRGPWHALANCGVATAIGAAMLAFGQRDWLSAALVGSLATALCDTLGTEIGQAYGGGSTWTLLPPRRVPPGTPGALSAAGTAAGIVGAALVGLAAAGLGLIPLPCAWVPVVAAALASLSESALRQSTKGRLTGHLTNALNTAVGALLAAALSRAC